jgi:hypothetical protein
MQQTLQIKTSQIFLAYMQKKTDMHHRYLFILLKKIPQRDQTETMVLLCWIVISLLLINFVMAVKFALNLVIPPARILSRISDVLQFKSHTHTPPLIACFVRPSAIT